MSLIERPLAEVGHRERATIGDLLAGIGLEWDGSGDTRPANTLYAAAATQEAGSDPREVDFSLDWIELVHGDGASTATWVRRLPFRRGLSVCPGLIAPFVAPWLSCRPFV